jgi:hypothetical protein
MIIIFKITIYTVLLKPLHCNALKRFLAYGIIFMTVCLQLYISTERCGEMGNI